MKKNINLILALCFSIPAIILFVMLGSHFSRRVIVLTGTEAEAEVISFTSNVTENDVDLYKLKFLFYDKDGNEHYGETSSKYLYEQATHMSTVKIKYDSNFKAIEADYGLDVGNIILFVFLGVFTFVDVFIWIAFAKDVKQRKIGKILEKSGYEATAEFIPNDEPAMTINNVPYYRITYKYIDHNGEEHTATSRETYTYSQMMYFSSKGSFNIKEDGNKSMITEEVKALNLKAIQEKQSGKVEQRKKQCQYCGTVVDEDCKICSQCGANRFKKIK